MTREGPTPTANPPEAHARPGVNKTRGVNPPPHSAGRFQASASSSVLDTPTKTAPSVADDDGSTCAFRLANDHGFYPRPAVGARMHAPVAHSLRGYARAPACI